MNQHDYYSMDALNRAMYDEQQRYLQQGYTGQQISSVSVWESLFGISEPIFSWEEIAKATRKHRYNYVIYQIKKQPFYGDLK